MNIQALMKQAQNLQKDMAKVKEEIDSTIFEVEKSFVKVVVLGNKTIKEIKVNINELAADDIEMLQDLVQVAINEAFSNIDKLTESKMGKFANIPGMF